MTEKVADLTFDTAQEAFHGSPSLPTAGVYLATAMQYEADDMIGDDTFLNALVDIRDWLTAQALPALDPLQAARLEERERIAAALDDEAGSLPCVEDAAVMRSSAQLVRADFSYDEAERIAEVEDQANV